MDAAPVSAASVVFKGRCPKCGQGKLYDGLLKIVECCSVCGFNFAGYDQADGPAFFSILIVGMLAGIGAAVTEIRYAPPYWVHAVVWFPFVIIASLLSLRWIKAALVFYQYRLLMNDIEAMEQRKMRFPQDK